MWIDAKLYLPVKLVAVSTEPAEVEEEEKDVRQIILFKPKVNKEIDKKIFEVKVPKGFGVEKVPLKKKAK